MRQRQKNKDAPRPRSAWWNAKLVVGLCMVLTVAATGWVGPLFRDVTQARVGSAPMNLPPIWAEGNAAIGIGAPNTAHPLGTEGSGRDMLTLLIAATPNSLRVGLVAAGLGMAVGIGICGVSP